MDRAVKDTDELNGLFEIMMGWSPDGWLVEYFNKKKLIK